MANVPHCPNCDRIMVRGSSVVGGIAMECPLHKAAPALLEALEAYMKGPCPSPIGTPFDKHVCQKARAAIVQAKGETV